MPDQFRNQEAVEKTALRLSPERRIKYKYYWGFLRAHQIWSIKNAGAFFAPAF